MKKCLLLLAVLLCVARPPTAQALPTPVTVDYNYMYTYSGTAPIGPAPWLTATFTDVAPNTVNLVLSTAGLTGTEFVSSWYFNVDPYVAGLTVTQIGGSPASSVPSLLKAPTGLNTFKAGSDGFYDLRLVFPTANGADRFGADETATLTIVGTGLTANSFLGWSDPGGPLGPFQSAAHVQGIGEYSGWVTPTQPVPEPSTVLLLASGLVSLPFLRRRFRK